MLFPGEKSPSPNKAGRPPDPPGRHLTTPTAPPHHTANTLTDPGDASQPQVRLRHCCPLHTNCLEVGVPV